MLKIFKKKVTTMLGIDISPNSVRLVELSAVAGSYILEAYAVAELPIGAMAERQIIDPERVGQVIAQLMQQVVPQAKHAAVALAGSAVISKVIAMEAGLADEELERLLQLEAEQHIPYPLEEVAIDFAVLGAAEQAVNKSLVLLVACRKENIAVREEALAVAGLRAKVVETESHALERVYPFIAAQLSPMAAEQTVAVVDISASLMTLNILQNGQSIYSREQVFAGQQLSRSRETFSNQRQAAQQSHWLDGQIDCAESHFADTVLEHLSRALQFLYAAGQHSAVDSIVLAGSVCADTGLAQYVQSKLGKPTLIANPFVAMQLRPTVNAAALERDAPSLLIACGLAMRGLADDQD